MNIVQMQESLKDLSDQQLYSQLQGGSTPPYLVMAEFSRRKRTRESAQRVQGEEPTVADELTAGGLAGLPDAQGAAFAARPEPDMAPSAQPVQRFQEGGKVGTFRIRGKDYPYDPATDKVKMGEDWVSPSTVGVREIAGSAGDTLQGIAGIPGAIAGAASEFGNRIGQFYTDPAAQSAMWERRRAEQEAQAKARRDILAANNRERVGLSPSGQNQMVDAASGRPVVGLTPMDTPQVPVRAEPSTPSVGLPTARAVGGDTAALLQEVQRISDPAEREAALGAMERSYPGSTAALAPGQRGASGIAPAGEVPSVVGASPAQNYLGVDMKGGIADLRGAVAPVPDTTLAQQYLTDLKGSISGREKDNLNMSLIRAGLATMSGTSQFALENLGKGLTEGLNAYATGKKDIDDLRRDIAKTEMEMEKARNSNDMELFRAKQAQLYALLQMSQKAIEGGLDRETQVRVAEVSASRATAAADRAAATEDARMKRQAMQFIAGLEATNQRYAREAAAAYDPAVREQLMNDIKANRDTIAAYTQEYGLPKAEGAAPDIGPGVAGKGGIADQILKARGK